MSETLDQLSGRQQREIDYHRERAQKHAALAYTPVDFEICRSSVRRWWNGYWTFWTLARAIDWSGQRVLLPGCGFGEDAIRVAALGAEVFASDISPDSVEIARSRAAREGYDGIHFDVGPIERMSYPNGFFDAILLINIMHHVEVESATAELSRVLKPGGLVLVNEVYTHDFLQHRVRQSWIVRKLLYPLTVRRIYGSDDPYITEDERKLSAPELDMISGMLHTRQKLWFDCLANRLFAGGGGLATKADRLLLSTLGRLGRYLGGRVVLIGRSQFGEAGLNGHRAAAPHHGILGDEGAPR